MEKKQNSMNGNPNEGVSVIVPVYNAARYLEKSVTSVLEGGHENVEIIIVDDASTDNTVDVIRRLEVQDARVHSVLLPVNGGPSVARNAALKEARLEWVALLDSDDWWAPGRLRYLLDIAARTSAHFVSDDIYIVAEGAEMPWATMYQLHNWQQSSEHVLLVHEFCARDWIPKPMFHIQWVRDNGLRYRNELRSGEEDFVFFLEALLADACWVMGDQAYYVYLQRRGSLTRSPKIAEALIASAEQIAADPRIRNNPLLRRAFIKRLNRIKTAHWRNLLADNVRRRRWLNAGAMVGLAPHRLSGLLSALWQRRRVHAMIQRASMRNGNGYTQTK